MEIRGNSADEVYYKTLKALIAAGHVVSPRNEQTLEVIGAHLIINQPWRNIITLPDRKLSYPFMVAEAAWMLTGSNDLRMIQPYNNRIAAYSDDGDVLKGAYGPKLIEQLPYVIETLKIDPSSRQAVLTIWRERPRVSKDIPCTIMMQFFVRDTQQVRGRTLDMVVYMRSNDAWWGMPYDIFSFTMIQQYVAQKLNAEIGEYHHMVGSLHLYDKHVIEASKLVAPDLSEIKNYAHDRIMPSAYPAVEMPDFFKTMFVGLTLMAKHAETREELLSWASSLNELPDPWRGMMGLLAYRFHKDPDYLVSPWIDLLTAQAGI